MTFRRSSISSAIGCLFLLSTLASAQDGVTFDDSASDKIRISNGTYEVTLSKINGYFVDITDRIRGVSLTAGSLSGCLWSATILSGGESLFAGGCAFTRLGQNQFRYSWNAPNGTLQLTYTSGSINQPSVNVWLAFSAAPYFEMRAVVENRTSGIISTVGVPASLTFPVSSIDAGYLPFFLPGAKLRPQFFRDRRNVAQTYPSQLCFADFLAVEIRGSMLSIYGVNPTDLIHPVTLGFLAEDASADVILGGHRYETNIPVGGSYSSPTVRIQVGGTVPELLTEYRKINKLDGYKALSDKLGTHWPTMARSQVLRADFQLFSRPLPVWTEELGMLAPPALIHPVGFQPGGHDKNYPDLLPPDPAYGTTADFKQFADAAGAQGFGMMPHTNYTWWSPLSPTLSGLTDREIKGLSVQNSAGEPLYEEYGNETVTNGGYVVSPAVDAVRNRVSAAWAQWHLETGIDALFVDQIGGRGWLRDYNPALSSPLHYQDGWISLMHSRPSTYFATEGGYDRLGRDFFAFFGSGLSGPATQINPTLVQWGVRGPANTLFGSGNWEP